MISFGPSAAAWGLALAGSQIDCGHVVEFVGYICVYLLDRRTGSALMYV